MKQFFYFLENCFKISDFSLNLGIVRGLDYYNGMVFEIKNSGLGAEKQICGGGEYELISLFKGRKTPTSGFAIGFDRTILSMEIEKINFPKKDLEFYIIPVNDTMLDIAIDIAMNLRLKEKRVDLDLMKRGVGKALKYASTRKAKKTIIIGPDEIKQGMVTIRNMDDGTQQLISINHLK
jgi:histidyl-tRNA synthetase